MLGVFISPPLLENLFNPLNAYCLIHFSSIQSQKTAGPSSLEVMQNELKQKIELEQPYGPKLGGPYGRVIV